jgi:hypothetical protein
MPFLKKSDREIYCLISIYRNAEKIKYDDYLEFLITFTGNKKYYKHWIYMNANNKWRALIVDKSR